MRPLVGKTALVTGAARGIGRAVALRLASKRVRLMLIDRDPVALRQAARAVDAAGGEAHAIVADVADDDALESVVAEAIDRWAGVDILVNNAGIAYYGPTHEIPPDRAESLLAINLRAPMRLTGLLLPAMLARPESHVLNVCSVLGLTALPKASLYCATKHGMVGFGAALRGEYGRRGLGVTTLCPGFVRTELFAPKAANAAGDSLPAPPRLLCVGVERVAAAAVRGIERNRRLVVVDPVGRVVRGLLGLTPGLIDRLQSLGRSRRVAEKHAELAALDPDLETALRVKVGSMGREARRSAAA